jgi:RHS repeat-associated protein
VATSSGQSEFYVPGLAEYNGSGWEYFTPDRLGSVRQLVDPTGQLLLAQSFDPFGNVLEQAGAGQSIFGYTGEQVDPSGLVYLRARYYDPAVGRFLSADSIVPDPLRSVGWNRYAYTGNNPLVYTDPSGHTFCRCGVDPQTHQCRSCQGGRSPLIPGFGTTTTAADPYSAITQIIGIGIAVAAHIILDSTPPFELPGFGEGVEPETGGGNICEPGPTLSHPPEQPMETFPLPDTTGPNIHVDAPEQPDVPNVFNAQMKRLSSGEIARLQRAGIDVHDLKGGIHASKRDLFKDKEGNIYVKPKSGEGPGESTGLNINDF